MGKSQEKSWVRPLCEAENHFLEVLVDSFSIKRKNDKGGVSMKVEFDSEAHAIWDRRGKDEIRKNMMPDYSSQWPKHAEKLDNFFFGNSAEPVFELQDKTFPFRFCSGGALPLITIGEKNYYRLHWRDIHPVGWNIVNGGSDNVLEMLDPQRVIYRELLEELFIFDIKGNDCQRLTPQIDDGPGWLENPVETEVLRKWEKRFRKNGITCNSISQERIALGWMQGHDDLDITYLDRKKNVVHHGKARNIFLNVNAEDFGIEIDSVVRIELPETAVICDGELLEGILLNSIIGLFEVKATHQALRDGKTEFKPDILFHSGRRYEGSELSRLVSRFLKEKHQKGLLRDVEKKQYEKAKQEKLEFNLCPVSRNIMRRVEPLMKAEVPKSDPFDVFISFASEDEKHAKKINAYLKEHLHKSVFFSPESIRSSDFTNEIFKALSEASCMIVVGSNPEHLRKNWVNFEYTKFFKNKMSRHSPPGKFMYTVLVDIPKDTPLPDPLDFYQAIFCRKNYLKKDLRILSQYLGT